MQFARTMISPSTNSAVLFPFYFHFSVGFLYSPEQIFILKRKNLKHGMHICCNIVKCSAQESYFYLVLSELFLIYRHFYSILVLVWSKTLSSKVGTTSNLLQYYRVQCTRTISLHRTNFESFPFDLIFSSPEHKMLSELLLSLTVRRCPSVHIFLVYTPASTNINQSVLNLLKMNTTIRSRMS